MIELSHSLCTHVCSTQCSQTANYAGPLYVYREAMDMSTSRNTMNMGRFITYLTILTKAMGRSITHNRKTMGKSITQLWTNPLHILENLLEGQMLITITMGRSSSHSRNHWQVHYPKKMQGQAHYTTQEKLWACHHRKNSYEQTRCTSWRNYEQVHYTSWRNYEQSHMNMDFKHGSQGLEIDLLHHFTTNFILRFIKCMGS